MSDALVLGIESSCDETAAAVVRGGREILSSVVKSQAAMHATFGGVVPELAGRAHLDDIQPAIDEALEEAGVTLDDVDAIA
ncbi:MAG: tRNA (adenosine(37)-N6)-threonylcarbamoyltransferase complex transferase subunit TsaD, partial [Planctomycetota bacterium]